MKSAPRFNLAFEVAFSLETAKKDEWTDEEWLAALKARVQSLENDPAELHEAAQSSVPYDVYEVQK
jgi:hypothetical protein